MAMITISGSMFSDAAYRELCSDTRKFVDPVDISALSRGTYVLFIDCAFIVLDANISPIQRKASFCS